MITVEISPLLPLESNNLKERHHVIFSCTTCGTTWSVVKHGTFYIPQEAFCLFCQETRKVKITE